MFFPGKPPRKSRGDPRSDPTASDVVGPVVVGAWAEKMLGKLGEKVGCTKTMVKYDEVTILNREIYTSLGDGFNFLKIF